MSEHRQPHHDLPWRSPRRTDLHAWLEVRGVVGGHRVPHERVVLCTDDRVRVVGSHLRAPDPDAPAVVLAHGFGAHRRKPAYAYLADHLSRSLHVLSLDLRGHGESGGTSTLGDEERHDVAAGLRYARLHHRTVVAVGFSMGGTATLHGLATGADADAAVIVSAPALVGDADNEALRRLDRLWRTAWRRNGWRLLTGIRLVGPERWNGLPHPRELAAKVDRPLLVVHADDDHFFGVHHGEELHAAAGGPAELWVEPAGFGHAEDGITPEFVDRLARAIHEVASTGRFPPR